MKLIKAKYLGYEPIGTVFSEVHNFSAKRVNELKDGCCDDIELDGFAVIWDGDEKGFFNGCLHLPSYVSLDKGIPVLLTDKDWLESCDTSTADFDENDLVVVWDKNEIRHMIDIFQLALNKLEATK